MIGETDLEILRIIGKSHLKILELDPHEVHEDEAAERLGRMMAGRGLEVTMPGEAWADLVATDTGLLKVDVERLRQLNLLDDVLAATRHTNFPVKAGALVGRVKVRGLAVDQEVLQRARDVAAGSVPVLEVLPYRPMQVGAVITGREVYEGRIKDAFAPLLRRRLEEYGSSLAHSEIVPDEVLEVSRAITSALATGLDMVFVTGGGSPDDCTSESIRCSADEVVFHGVPVAPGPWACWPTWGMCRSSVCRPVCLPALRGFLDLILPRLLLESAWVMTRWLTMATEVSAWDARSVYSRPAPSASSGRPRGCDPARLPGDRAVRRQPRMATVSRQTQLTMAPRMRATVTSPRRPARPSGPELPPKDGDGTDAGMYRSTMRAKTYIC